MPKRPIMDPTKAPCGALTMVYQDYALLDRWVRYYADQFDRKHLYILSHGGDPKHREIGEGCNVISVPRDPTCYRLERRRWTSLNDFHAGLLHYYNWLIVTDVDEIVVLDPDGGDRLQDYLAGYGAGMDPDEAHRKTPRSISPFGIELIHNPEEERAPLSPDAPILERRRNFRANANYAKPCVLRRPTRFTIGGHANTHQPRYLDPHLFLVHLRFYDYETMSARLKGRQELRTAMDTGKDTATTGHAWKKDFDTFQRLSAGRPVREDSALPDFRRRMVEGQKHLHDGKVTFWGGGRSKELYRLPERFASLV